MRVGWRWLSTESAGVGEKRLWLTGLLRCGVQAAVGEVPAVVAQVRARVEG